MKLERYLERELTKIKGLIGVMGVFLNGGFAGLFGFLAYETLSFIPVGLAIFHLVIAFYLVNETNKIVRSLEK